MRTKEPYSLSDLITEKEVNMLRRFMLGFIPVAVCLLWTTVSFGLTNQWTGQVEGMPVVLGEGGPDAYGYTWVDSDTAIGPTFSWIDTTSGWTEVLGLFDDNVVGPFSIGFTFPYYWYGSDQFYVGSNGYISLSDLTLEAADFQPLPDPQRPNDVLAPLMDDLDFTNDTTTSPSCYYWTNAAADTFIISYLTVAFWNSPASSNTFQIILSGTDSTITFQILDQTGPSMSIGNRTVGIEDITGTVGLGYLHGFDPPENVVHSNLSILFTPPDSTTFQMMDAALTDVGTPGSKGFILLPTDSTFLWAKVKNTGNQLATFFDVYCYVMDTLGTYYFGDTVNIAALNPGEVDSTLFTPSWTPAGEGTYFVKARVDLSGDGVPVNDSSMAEILVVDYPGELSWIDGTLEAGFAWNGSGSGWANEYTPPRYPCLVQSVSVEISSCENPPKDVKLMLMEDDTPDGSPGSVLAETTFSVLAGGMFTYNLWPNQNWVFTDGSFFVGYIQLEEAPGGGGDPFIGMDYSQPRSRRGWEFTGSWAPHRDNDSMDVALLASVDDAPGPILLEAFATDGPTGGPGIDDDDYVRLEFNAHTNIPTIDQTNIDNILPLGGGHTWLSVDGSLGSAVWSVDSTQLIVYLTTSGGVPTVAVGDMVYPDSVTIQDRWGIACKSPRLITGSFEVGIEESPFKKFRYVNMLHLARPNPFTSYTRVEYEISSRALTRVRVYDITGRTIATLVEEVRDPGRYVTVWDGKSSGGRRVSSGIYFYRMEAGSFTSTRKVTLLK